MLNFILPILKNPLTRLIGQKVIGGIQHKIEKDKIIKAREIEAVKTMHEMSQDQLERMGKNGKNYYLANFDFKQTLNRLNRLLVASKISS